MVHFAINFFLLLFNVFLLPTQVFSRNLHGPQLYKPIEKFGIYNMLNEIYTNHELENIVRDLVNQTVYKEDINCIAILCDTIYLNLFRGQWFRKMKTVPFFMIVVQDSEDLLSPNFDTLESIRQIRNDGCKAYVILLSNGIQVGHLLKFGDRYRVLDTRAKYIMLHDFRIFQSDLHYIWKRIVNVVFIRHYAGFQKENNQTSWFELSTVPFPAPIRAVMVPRRLATWKDDKKFRSLLLFKDKTLDMKEHTLRVVALQHIPAVVSNTFGKSETDIAVLGGMEIEISNTFAKIMNFKAKLYQPINVAREMWGRKQQNGSFSGLLGEMVEGKADIALGNLHYTPYHLQLTDLTIPYISECLTFLTPESLTDNSWKTLILPFKLYMWIAVLLVLLVSGFIFYALARFHKKINQEKENTIRTKTKNKIKLEPSTVKEVVLYQKNNVRLRKEPAKKRSKDPNLVGLYLFEELTNSILYTYGMLLVVSLPKLPPGWSIRLLTGWYWLYCVLVVVSYRASMTAILAMPPTRVTIDTVKQLADSPITCAGWGEQTKEFFLTSLDETGQKIGSKFASINEVKEAVYKIAKGDLAYYENIYFLKYLTVKYLEKKTSKSNKNENDEDNNSNMTEGVEKKSSGDRNLHVMRECAVNMPISIGLQKNSPLKPRFDKLLRRIIEAGLVEKWLNDVMVPIIATLSFEEENIKAIMNLKKLYGGFMALGIGYALSSMVFIAEIIYWRFVVKRDPIYDEYALDLYYARKK